MLAARVPQSATGEFDSSFCFKGSPLSIFLSPHYIPVLLCVPRKPRLISGSPEVFLLLISLLGNVDAATWWKSTPAKVEDDLLLLICCLCCLS